MTYVLLSEADDIIGPFDTELQAIEFSKELSDAHGIELSTLKVKSKEEIIDELSVDNNLDEDTDDEDYDDDDTDD